MALNLASDRPLMGMLDLERLVGAITAASAEDEPEWLEWKSSLDLISKTDLVSLARQIVGMANRDPDRARVTAGGFGYIVIGADHDGVHGVERRDPAELGDVLRPLLGDDGPRWDLTYHRVSCGQDVLIVVVAPPRPGDPIHRIRRSSGKVESGDILVRSPGQVRRADAEDIARLSLRLTSVDPSLDLSVSCAGNPLPLVDLDPDWVADRVLDETLLVSRYMPPFTATARGQAVRYRIAVACKAVGRVLQALDKPGRGPGFDSEVDAYLNEVRRWLQEAGLRCAAAATPTGHGFLLHNASDTHLQDLSMKITVHGPVVACEGWQRDPWSAVPPRPRWWPADLRSDRDRPTATGPAAPGLAEVQLEKDGDSVAVVIEGVQLRAHSTARIAADVAVVAVDDAPIHATWTATSTTVPGRHGGAIDITASSARLPIGRLLVESAPEGPRRRWWRPAMSFELASD